jgi:DNA replication protein DnaD
MSAPTDLYDEMRQKRRELNTCIKMLRKTGTELAEAERDYKIKLREWVLRLRSQEMAVGLIQLTVYGIPEVAELRFKRDIAQTVYDANKDAVNATKLEMRIIEAQIGREWSDPQADM